MNNKVCFTASQRSSVLVVLTESELVMLDVSKPPKEVQCGDDTVKWLVGTSMMNDGTLCLHH